MLDYWRLPGPAGFLTDVTNDIGSGRNVVLLLPDSGPPELLQRLRDSLRDHWLVRTLDKGTSGPPLHEIYRCLLGEVPEDPAMTTSRLAADERLIGHLVLVESVSDKNWHAWKQFLQDYELGCRVLPADRRMLIVLVGRGAQTLQAPPSEVALGVFQWNGWAGEIDTLVYASLCVRNIGVPVRKRNLLATCLAKIALWDTAVVDEFCADDPEKVIEPVEILTRVGASRGWTVARVPNWQDGTSHVVDGSDQVHSAYLACHTPDYVMRRVWSAQASALLPLIEERRTELLPQVARYIKLPVITNLGTVDRIEDLEVGQMLWKLEKEGAEKSLVRKVARLKRFRDALAHLKPLPKEMALDPVLIG